MVQSLRTTCTRQKVCSADPTKGSSKPHPRKIQAKTKKGRQVVMSGYDGRDKEYGHQMLKPGGYTPTTE